jgi:hypothetical protein
LILENYTKTCWYFSIMISPHSNDAVFVWRHACISVRI